MSRVWLEQAGRSTWTLPTEIEAPVALPAHLEHRANRSRHLAVAADAPRHVCPPTALVEAHHRDPHTAVLFAETPWLRDLCSPSRRARGW